jgi:hypothetical protein
LFPYTSLTVEFILWLFYRIRTQVTHLFGMRSLWQNDELMFLLEIMQVTCTAWVESLKHSLLRPGENE